MAAVISFGLVLACGLVTVLYWLYVGAKWLLGFTRAGGFHLRDGLSHREIVDILEGRRQLSRDFDIE